MEIGSFSLTIRYSLYGVTLRPPSYSAITLASVFTVCHAQGTAVIPVHMNGSDVIHEHDHSDPAVKAAK